MSISCVNGAFDAGKFRNKMGKNERNEPRSQVATTLSYLIVMGDYR